MTLYVLKLAAPHPITGFQPELLGARFSGVTAMDAFQFLGLLQKIGWKYSMTPDEIDPINLQQCLLTKDGVAPSLMVRNTDWFATDGTNCYRLPDTDITTGKYTVTPWAGSPPAPQPEPDPEPEPTDPQQDSTEPGEQTL